MHGVINRNNISFVSVFLHLVILEWRKKGEMAGLRAHIIRYNTFYHQQYLILYFRPSQKTFGSAEKPLSMSPWPQVLSLVGIWLYKQRSGAVSLFPERQQHQLCSWLPFPSITTPLAGTASPLPCLVSAGSLIPVLIHGIFFIWALLRRLCWCSAPPPVRIRGSQAPLQRHLIEGCASATAARGEPELPAYAPSRTCTILLCSIFPAPD